jgi:hypothetical protein
MSSTPANLLKTTNRNIAACTPGTIARSASRIVIGKCAELRRIAQYKTRGGQRQAGG